MFPPVSSVTHLRFPLTCWTILEPVALCWFCKSIKISCFTPACLFDWITTWWSQFNSQVEPETKLSTPPPPPPVLSALHYIIKAKSSNEMRSPNMVKTQTDSIILINEGCKYVSSVLLFFGAFWLYVIYIQSPSHCCAALHVFVAYFSLCADACIQQQTTWPWWHHQIKVWSAICVFSFWCLFCLMCWNHKKFVTEFIKAR